MIPLGPILVGVAMAMRAAGQGRQGAPAPAPRGGGGGYAALVWIIGMVSLPLALIVLAEARGRSVGAYAWFAVLALFLFPWWVVRRVLVPLGLPRLAYVVTHLADVRWRSDRRGGAALAAAWALLRKRRLRPELAEWVERRLQKGKMLRGGGIVASGLLAAARGDLASARTLLASSEALMGRGCTDEARRLAREWRAVDAAARGRWGEVIDIAEMLGPQSATTRFLGVVAGRLVGKGASRARLGWRWLWAPERLETWTLMRRAWRTRPSTGLSEAAPLPPREDPFEDALARHATLLAARTPRLAALRALAESWDKALAAPQLKRRAAERALSLGARSGESAVQRLEGLVVDDVAALLARLDAAELVPEDGGLLWERAVAKLRDEKLGHVEALSASLRQRAVDKRALPAIDEWREFLALQRAFEDMAQRCGLMSRRMAFSRVHPDACKQAVWLWNERGEKTMANAIFQWLWQEAEAVGDEEAAKLQRNNTASGPG